MSKLFNRKNIPYILIAVSFFILLIKTRFGFCWSDETFYSAITSRFYNGDALFFDEWFPTQLASIILLPFYTVFVKLTGGTVGIILFFRVLYVIFELICATTVYNIISRHHGAFLGTVLALLTQWYAHLNIATLSYYTMSVLFFLLSMLLIYDSYMISEDKLPSKDGSKKIRLELIRAGVSFALCVLCLPTMCVAYFLVVFAGFIVVILNKLFSKNKLLNNFARNLDFLYTFMWTLVGIIIPAAIFAVYMLTHVSIRNFVDSLKYVLSDDEHEMSKLYPLKKMYLAISENEIAYGKYAYIGFAFILAVFCIFALMLVCKYSRNENLRALYSFIINTVRPLVFAADILLFALYFILGFGKTGYIFTAIMMFSLPLFLITERKNWRLFILSFVSGLMFSLVFSYSSNGMLYVLSMGHFITAVGGMIFISDFTCELSGSMDANKSYGKQFKAIISSAVMVIAIICVLQTAVLRITNIYRDDQLSKLSEKITEGPAAGIYTSKEHHEMYIDVCEVIKTYCMKSNDHENLLISKLLPFGYTMSDMRVSAPTVWRNPMDSLRLKEFYELHEDRYPDVILVLNEEYGGFETCGDVVADYEQNANASEGYIYDYINENNFEEIDVKCGKIYRR